LCFGATKVSFLFERGAVRRTASGVEFDGARVVGALPESVQALLTSRVDRLSSDDRAVLQAAAVIGPRFSSDLLGAVSDTMDNIEVRLIAMQILDLVRRDDKSVGYMFKHSLVRDALYNSLLL
jgi:predicted ATPase